MRIKIQGVVNEEILYQIGKITVLRVTGGVHPELKNSRMRGKNARRLRTYRLSKNVMLHRNPCIIASCITRELSLSTH
jgi:hypothetical protein